MTLICPYRPRPWHGRILLLNHPQKMLHSDRAGLICGMGAHYRSLQIKRENRGDEPTIE